MISFSTNMNLVICVFVPSESLIATHLAKNLTLSASAIRSTRTYEYIAHTQRGPCSTGMSSRGNTESAFPEGYHFVSLSFGLFAPSLFAFVLFVEWAVRPSADKVLVKRQLQAN